MNGVCCYKKSMLEVTGGKIWYQVVGDGENTPLIVLHGGPGFPHNSLRPLATLANERPVVFYDQLGCGKSDRPNDKSLWTIHRFVEELKLLIDELGFDSFNLFGHSWGSILALEYYLLYPDDIRKIIFASPVFSTALWEQDGATLVQALPAEHQSVIKAYDEGNPYDAYEFEQAEAEFHRRHFCRLNPWPKDLKESVANFGIDVYHYMWGNNEWRSTGTLKNYNSIDRLSKIKVPALLTCGWHDSSTPETTLYYQQQIPDAQLKVFENSSHAAFLEDREQYIATIRSFL